MRKFILTSFFLSPFLGFSQFSEDFEGPGVPEGWTVINRGDPNKWEQLTVPINNVLQANTGRGFMYIMYNSRPHDDHLITPMINVVSGLNHRLGFYCRSRDPAFPERISVKISETGTRPEDFDTVLIADISPPGGRLWYPYSVDLSGYDGKNVYVDFHSQSHDMFIFDFDTLTNTGTISTDETTKKLSYKVYPNPVTDYLHVSNSDEKITSIEMYSLDGKKALTERRESNHVAVDMRDLPNGVYLVKIKTKKGETQLKVIKN